MMIKESHEAVVASGDKFGAKLVEGYKKQHAKETVRNSDQDAFQYLALPNCLHITCWKELVGIVIILTEVLA